MFKELETPGRVRYKCYDFVALRILCISVIYSVYLTGEDEEFDRGIVDSARNSMNTRNFLEREQDCEIIQKILCCLRRVPGRTVLIIGATAEKRG